MYNILRQGDVSSPGGNHVQSPEASARRQEPATPLGHASERRTAGRGVHVVRLWSSARALPVEALCQAARHESTGSARPVVGWPPRALLCQGHGNHTHAERKVPDRALHGEKEQGASGANTAAPALPSTCHHLHEHQGVRRRIKGEAAPLRTHQSLMTPLMRTRLSATRSRVRGAIHSNQKTPSERVFS